MADRYCSAPINGAGPSPSGDVLMIVSEGDHLPPDAIKRRSAHAITEELQQKLVAQGIPPSQQQDEVTLIRARYELDHERKVRDVMMSESGGALLSRADVLQQINIMMSNTSTRQGKPAPPSSTLQLLPLSPSSSSLPHPPAPPSLPSPPTPPFLPSHSDPPLHRRWAP